MKNNANAQDIHSNQITTKSVSGSRPMRQGL